MRFTKFKLFAGGIGDGWELHRMRHTAITEMLRAGYPLHEVQRIAGHARIQQTLAYAELLPDDLVKTAARQSDVLSKALCPAPQPTMAAA
jgi:integrase